MPHCAIFSLVSPVKDKVSFELKILLKMCLEGPTGVGVDRKAEEFSEYLVPTCSSVSKMV